MRIIAENLRGDRGGQIIFEGIGFVLTRQDCLTVTGPNGSGKSTLLRIVAGLLRAAAGHVRLEEGEPDWSDLAAAAHYLGHLNAMKPALSVADNLSFWRAFLGRSGQSVTEALDRVGLEGVGDLPFGYLSTGQKRRAAIARLLVSHRPIWLLDEPTSGLDEASRSRLLDVMNAHLKSGGIILAATHVPLGLDQAQELSLGRAG